MKKLQRLWILSGVFMVIFLMLCGNTWGSEINAVIDVQKYNRAIHIMAMVIAGIIAGEIVSMLSNRLEPYNDAKEFYL